MVMLMCTVFANCYSKYYSKLKSSSTIFIEKAKEMALASIFSALIARITNMVI